MYMFKIGAILSLFAIFNNFTSFYVFFFLYVRYELQVHKIIEYIYSKNDIHVHETSLRLCT
jgi:hypothetical protein